MLSANHLQVHASYSHDARVAALPTIHHGEPIAIPERDTTFVVSGVEHDHKFNSLKGEVLRDESSNTRALQIDAPNANFTITDPNGSSNDFLDTLLTFMAAMLSSVFF